MVIIVCIQKKIWYLKNSGLELLHRLFLVIERILLFNASILFIYLNYCACPIV